MRGGFIRMNPADLGDTSMDSSRNLSLAQGGEYAKIHAGQHGGQRGGFAPVGSTGVLDINLRSSAYLGPLDESYNAIQGMTDQAGGKRRKSKTKRRAKKSRRVRRRRTHKGGSMGAPYSETGSELLLPSSETVFNMNEAEWKLAEDPNSFVPDSLVKVKD